VHELALCRSVIRIIEDEAPRRGFACVSRVRLEVGRLAGVEVYALRRGFELARSGTLAENADLDVTETPGAGWCEACACEVPLAARFDPCPGCGNRGLRPVRGTELRVLDLEVT